MKHNGGDAGPTYSLLFALFEAADRLRARIDEALGTVGLSSARYGVLDHLARAGEPLPLGELASRISCVRSNVTQLVDRLEADGLVRREHDTADRRSVLAELTPTGRERHAAGTDQYRRVVAEFELQFSEPERARILALLSSVD
jgi:DNA-binding MarR family transcriptional regulator